MFMLKGKKINNFESRLLYKDIIVDSLKKLNKKAKLNVEKISISNDMSNKLKLKRYDLININNIEIDNDSIQNDNYFRVTVPFDYTYSKYKVCKVNENKIEKVLKTSYKNRNVVFETEELGEFALYGKKKTSVFLLLAFILLIALISFSISYSSIPKFRDVVTEIFKLDKPTAPKISAEYTDWSLSNLVSVVEDSKVGGTGKLDYYQYCVNKSKEVKTCNWQKTYTKNNYISKDGIYYVWYRGVSDKKTIGNISNMVEVKIDTSAPTIKNIEVSDVSANGLKLFVDAVDSLSGINKYIYEINGNIYEKIENEISVKNLTHDTEYNLNITVIDNVGNKATYSIKIKTLKSQNDIKETENKNDSEQVTEDKTLTMPTYNVDPSNDTWSTYKYVTINYPTAATIKEYSLDGGKTWNKYENPILFLKNGTVIARCSNDENAVVAEPFDVIFIDPVLPTISLDNVPSKFEYTEDYDLPGYTKFGESNGTYSCTVDGVKQSDTSTIKIGKHLIECSATSGAGATTKVSKEIEVTYIDGQNYTDGAWTNLVLNYPEGSTNRKWMVYDQNTVVKYDSYYYQWSTYVGPIKVRTEDVKKIIIMYDMDGRTITSSYSGNPYVLIQPEDYLVKEGKKTKVTLLPSSNNYIELKYKLGELGAWQDYTGTFEVGPNTLIEAKIVTKDDVYEDGQKIGEKKNTSFASTYIGILKNNMASSGTTDNKTTDYKIEIKCPESLTIEEIGKCSIYFGESFGATSYKIESVINPNQNSKYIGYNSKMEFDVLAGDIIYARGQYLDSDNNIQTITKTFKIYDNTNNQIIINSNKEEFPDGETAEITINYSDKLISKEYRVNYGNWQDYTGTFEVGNGSFIEARGKVLESSKYAYSSKQLGSPINEIEIKASTTAPYLGNTSTITINYNKYMTIRKYRINGGDWQDYTKPFTVGPDTTVEAWGKINNYYDVFENLEITHSIKDPSYYLNGPNINFKDTDNKYVSEVTITTDKPARWIKYRFGRGNSSYSTYEYPIKVNKGTWVCAIYQDETDGIISDESCDMVLPEYDYGYRMRPIVSYRLSSDRKTDNISKVEVTLYPGGAKNLQYSFDNVIWHDYTEPFEVYQNTRIYYYGSNDYGSDKGYFDIDHVNDIAPSPKANVEDIKFNLNPSGKEKSTDESGNTVYTSPDSVDVTITYDNTATSKFYRIGTSGSWIPYKEKVQVKSNCTIYAYQITPNGTSSASQIIDYMDNGYAEPIIDYNPKSTMTSLVTVDIAFDQNSVKNTYSIDGNIFEEYTGSFDVTTAGTVVYAKSEFADGTIKTAIEIVGMNISAPIGRVENYDDYYILYLNYPTNSYEPSRKYKYKKNGMLTNYKEEGIMLIKEERVNRVLDADGNAYVHDSNGKKIKYNGDYYLLDVDISAAWEYIYMTWENGEVESPVIIPDTKTGWVKDVKISISYPKDADKKEYKIILSDGTSTGWLDYSGTLTINKLNTKIYARAINKVGAISKESYYEVTNVDNNDPSIRYLKTKSTKNSITVFVELSGDNQEGYDKSGIDRYEYSLDKINWIQSKNAYYTFEDLAVNTSYTIYVKATDMVGNESQVYSIVAKTNNLDKPEFKVEPDNNTWASSKKITIEYLQGNYTNEYSLDLGATWVKYTDSITVTSPTTIIARCSDGTNASYSSLTVNRVDNTKPSISFNSMSALSSRITVNVTGVDRESGILKYYYSLDGENYFTSFNPYYIFNNLEKNKEYTVYIYCENMAGLVSDVEKNNITTSEIDPPYVTEIKSYDDKHNLLNSTNENGNNIIDNSWSYTKEIVINYPYIDEDCNYEYAIVDLNNPENIKWKDALIDKTTGNSTAKIEINKEDNAVIARVVSGPNIVTSSTITLNKIDRTEPTIDLSGLPRSLEIGESYELPTNFAGDNSKSGAIASCNVKGNIVSNTSELRSGMHPLECTVTTGAGHSVTIKHTLPIYPSLTFNVDSILQGVKNASITTGGDFYFNVETKNETIKYPVEMWLYEGDTVLNDPTEKFCDNIEDKMCIIKVNGNLTISSNVNLEPQVNKKGFLIYVTGKLVNNGSIKMTGLGKSGVGENVYLYKNDSDTYEIVPANGGSGALESVAKNSSVTDGNNGILTSRRATGGGGSGGAIINGNYTATSGAGGNGTSYSGGSGGGAAVGNCNVAANSGEQYALAGGLGAICGTGNFGIGGGVGNPTAKSTPYVQSNNGAGGLLIIYANNFENNNVIESNGIDAPNISGNNASSSMYAAGGGSGAGSINIFYDNVSKKGTVNAIGGKGGIASNATKTANGGNGADGKVTFNTIVDDSILGSKINPYKITNAQEFIDIKNIINDYDSAYIELENDIDLSGYKLESIGTNSNPFAAYFDGKNHTISNVTLKEENNDVGLFGVISNGEIKNLNIVNADVIGKSNVGILAGSIYDDSKISNVKVTGKINGVSNIGGLAGYVNSTNEKMNIFDIVTNVDINATGDNVGGLIGKIYNVNKADVKIQNSGAITNIDTTGNKVGGLVGLIDSSSNGEVTIENSYSDKTIKGNDYVGGLIGKANSLNSKGIIIEKATSGAEVTGNNYVGGFIGAVENNEISNAYSVGNVNSNDYAGSFIGYSKATNITNTYATGTVNSVNIEHVGGFVGEAINSTSINSYFSSQTTKYIKTALGLNARIQKLLYKDKSYNDFDFENIWGIENGKTTAYIKGLYIPLKTSKDNLLYNTLQGEGSINNPYLIYNSTDLIEINNELNANYKMMADVDLTGIDFDPIGQENFAFTGTLDGNNHKITGLIINKNNLKIKDNVGLFEVLENAVITNLTIENANITGDNNVGILAGKIVKGANINNVKVSGSIEASNANNKVLEIIPSNIKNPQNVATALEKITSVKYTDWLNYLNGTNGQPLDIISPTVANNIESAISNKSNALYNTTGINIYTGRVGGLVGYIDIYENDYDTNIINTTADTNIKTDGIKIGGLIGKLYNEKTSKQNLVVQNTTSSLIKNELNNDYVGGFAGEIVNDSVNSISIKDLNINGNITGNNYTGGIVGTITNNANSQINIENIESTFDIDSIGNNVGGLIGLVLNNASGIINIENAMSTSQINANNYVGGLIGQTQNIAKGTININNLGSNGSVTGNASIGGAFGSINSYSTGQQNVKLVYSNSNVTASNNEVGGFAGRISSSSTTKVNNISKSYATGNVEGLTDVGGFVGITTYSTYNDTFATGSTTAQKKVGSYVGEAGQTEINNSYAIGRVNASTDEYVGGFAGVTSNITANNDYFSSQTTGYLKTAVGINNKIYKLLRSNTYANYDFESIWTIDEDSSTAYIQGLPQPESVLSKNIKYNKMQGEGTEENPYIIVTPDDVNDIRNEASAYYVLANDIDMSEYEIDGLPMIPIGEAAAPFSGTIDGQGYTIRNYSYSQSGDNVGLFSLVTNATFKNLTLENFEISGRSNVGILAGNVTEGINLENVTVSGKVNGVTYSNVKSTNVGGIIGNLTLAKVQENNFVNVDANVITNGVLNVGGIIGAVNQKVDNASLKIDGTDVSGEIAGINYIGGVIGNELNSKNSNFEILNSTNNATINSSDNALSIGGLVGFLQNQSNGNLLFNNLTNNANITSSSTSNIGGIIGILRNSNKGSLIFNKINNNGIITGKDYVGGLAGYIISSSSINKFTNYKNSGNIIANNQVGSMIGQIELNLNKNTSEISDVTNIASITGVNNVGGIIGAIISKNNSSYEIKNALNESTLITANSNVGGIVGLAYTTGLGKINIMDSMSSADINSVGNYNGGIAGQLYSTNTSNAQDIKIENSYNTGDITATNGSYVGGIVGNIYANSAKNAVINKVYSIGNIKALSYTGGIVGASKFTNITNVFATGTYKNVTIENPTPTKADYIGGIVGSGISTNITTSYAITPIKANGNLLDNIEEYDKYNTGLNVGSIIGYSDKSIVTDSYFVSELTGIVRGVNGTSITINDLVKQNTFNYDFENIWTIEENTTSPYIQGLPKPDSIDATKFIKKINLNGSGTEEDPYLIGNLNEFNFIRYDLNAYYKLIDDIDLTVNDSGTKFLTIGEMKVPFSGVLDGNNHMIYNNTIDSFDDSVGIFDSLKNATIKNLTIKNVNYIDNKYVGALAGMVYENVNIDNVNIVNTANEMTGVYVGGLIGYISQIEDGNTNISNIDIKAAINAHELNKEIVGGEAGGLIGHLYDSGVNNISINNITVSDESVISIKTKPLYSASTNEVFNKNIGGLIGKSVIEADNTITIDHININGTLNEMLSDSNSTHSHKYKFNIGGLIGLNEIDSSSNYKISNSSIKGKLKQNDITTTKAFNAEGNIGGAIGYQLIKSSEITNKSTVTLDSIESAATFEINPTITNIVNGKYMNINYQANIGGLIGKYESLKATNKNLENKSNLIINGSYLTTDINIPKKDSSTGQNYTGTLGGLVGDTSISSTGKFEIKSSYVTGNITGNDYVGGIIGNNEQLEVGTNNIELTYTTGNITGDNYVGGLVGNSNGVLFNTFEINKTYTTGDIIGNNYVGGIVGKSKYLIVNDSFTTGKTIGDDNTAAFAGEVVSTQINNSYAVGEVTSTNTIGGFVHSAVDSQSNNSYFSSDSTKLYRTAIGQNMRLYQMIKRDPCYANWNFTDIWEIDSGNTLAYLKELPIPDSVKASNYNITSYKGNGVDEAYEIYTPEDLSNMRVERTAYYKLMNDIDMSNVVDFAPIGEENQVFEGTLDGQGYKIKNLTISDTGFYNGLFGVVSDATIKNITLDNLVVNSTVEDTGGLIGLDKGNTRIENININYSSINSTGNNTGGLIGRIKDNNINETVIKNVNILPVTSNDYIIGNYNTGGLIGYIENESSEEIYISDVNVSNANIQSNLNKDVNIGGLIGYAKNISDNSKLTINNQVKLTGNVNINDGELIVSESTINSGGLIGKLETKYGTTKINNINSNMLLNHNMNVTNSSTLKTITNRTGGLIGYNLITGYGSTTISNIETNSDLITNPTISSNTARTTYTGGLIGENANSSSGSFTLKDSYSNRKIEGISFVGGLIGFVNNSSTGSNHITNSYSDGKIIGTENYIGGIFGSYTSTKETQDLVDKIFTSSEVSGKNYVGGFAGQLTYVNINDSYSLGKTTAENYVSGFVASTDYSNYNNIYTISKIKSSGKFIGSITSKTNNDEFNNSYYSSEATGYSASKAGINRRFEKMLHSDTFNGYDFTDIWTIEDGTSTPYIQGMISPNVTSISYAILLGSGTKEDPYLIHNAKELQAMSGELDAYYKLAQDIDMTLVSAFNPIGTEDAPFTGTLDGDGHKISNLTINYSLNDAGLLGYIKDASVINLNLVDANVTTTAQYAGVIAGRVVGNSNMKQLNVSGSVTSSSDYVGGLIGELNTAEKNIINISDVKANMSLVKGNDYIGGVIGNVSNILGEEIKINNITSDDITVEGNDNVGGLFGKISNTYTGIIKLENLDSNAKVNANSYVGALAGNIANVSVGDITLNKLFAKGQVNASNDFVGGIAGALSGTLSNNLTADELSSDVEVNGRNYTGVLTGKADYLVLNNAAITGKIGGLNYTGGLIGQANNSVINHTYAYAKPIDYLNNYGGLIGNISNTTVNDSYYSDVISLEVSTTGNNVDQSNMFNQSTYSEFDFTNIWNIQNNSTLPYLKAKNYSSNQESSSYKNLTITADTLEEALKNNEFDTGIYRFIINDKVTDVDLYNFDTDQVWIMDKVFGRNGDLATASTYARRMVIVKVNGNLTINSGVKVGPYYSTYGGPKGFTIYVTNTLTNNGTIDNSHGAKAQGQDVYLFKNNDGTYEYVPAIGAAGGYGISGNYGSCTCSSRNGNAGYAGSNRGTGGGGSGHGASCCGYYESKRGGTGTSYSGGTGSGEVYDCYRGSVPSNEGGTPGSSCSYNSISTSAQGAGNPGNGTGGLLNIYTSILNNNGKITANGSVGQGSGGSSGGGSINIFYNNNIVNNGTINAYGGSYTGGGAGGAGSVTTGKIIDGKFYKIDANVSLKQNNIKIFESIKYPKYSLESTTIGESSIKLETLIGGYQKLQYSLDGGSSWNDYSGEFIINDNSDLKVKGIISDTEESDIVDYQPVKYLLNEVFDNNKNTSNTLKSGMSYRIDLDTTLSGLTFRAYLSSSDITNSNIKFFDSSNNELKSIKLNDTLTTGIIPENTYYVVINVGNSDIELKEINVREVNVSKAKNNLADISINQVGYYNKKVITINYPSNQEYTKEYSIDNGNTWIEYTEPIELTENKAIVARVVENDEVISSSIYNITKVDTIIPTIDLNDIPDEMDVGSDYILPSNYSVNGSKAGYSYSCKVGDREYETTKLLPVGNNEIICTIKTSANNSATVTKIVNVKAVDGYEIYAYNTEINYNNIHLYFNNPKFNHDGEYCMIGIDPNNLEKYDQGNNECYVETKPSKEYYFKKCYFNNTEETCSGVKKVMSYKYEKLPLLIQLKDNSLESGYKDFKVNGVADSNSEEITYTTHIYTFEGNQEWSENKTFGDANDVGTATDYAKNMVIVRVNGDLTINSGVVVSPYHNNYGGPKGFIIYVTGKLINNGTIINNYGAKAKGENVYLLSNNDSYEYIPATGATGGSALNYVAGGRTGNNGDKLKRTTAGGGTGGIGYANAYVGTGGTGTSYSGGPGAGGAYNGSSTASASNEGGAGSAGTAYALYTYGAGGGAGNPGGAGISNGGAGGNGTGGLIVIYANIFENNGTITANGSAGGWGYRSGGGGSGGGSINIFVKENIKTGTLQANGGAAGAGTRSGGETNSGGRGGNGSINIGKITDNDTYESLN